MSGPHEDNKPVTGAPRAEEQPTLVESVPLFPRDAPPVPPLPSDASPAPQPAYRRTRAEARGERFAEAVEPEDIEATLPAARVSGLARAQEPSVVSAPVAPLISPAVVPRTEPTAAVPARPFSDQPPAPPVAKTPDTAASSAAMPSSAPRASAPHAGGPPSSLPHVAVPHATATRPTAGPVSVPDMVAAPVVDAASRREQRELRDRHSFLQTERPEEPAREGARGILNRLGFRVRPSAAEQATRDDELAVSQHWPGPRTIAVVNGKGGAGKTPTTILLSAVFARYGGAGVLAWDNNQTRGTLGWRTDTGAHDRTLLEMLPEVGRLLGTGAQSADLAHYMHHQPREKYDVLRSKPIRLAHENRLSPEDVDAIHSVAAKFYRLIIIDSGNDESDPMWLRMIDHADQLVVATTTRDDHAEAGALLLEALEDRDERSARLAQQSVVVVSQADPKATPSDVDHVVSGYRTLARDVVSIPFDHEMVDGHLRYGALAKRTQRAWLAAAASVARGF